MDKDFMCRYLPERARSGFESWMKLRMAEEFVQDMMIFSAERIAYTKENGKRHSRWATNCVCTACTNEFLTKHIPGRKGFVLYQGEDSCLYPIDPWDDVAVGLELEQDFGFDPCDVEIGEGDQIMCPWCGENVEVIHKSSLRGGRTRQLLGCSVENVAGYTAVVCWLAARKWYDDGNYDVDIYPRDAYVIGERGGLTRFRHTKGTGAFSTEQRTRNWQVATNLTDSFAVPYHDWGSINNRKIGGCVWQECGDLEGQTGEKTGLATYVRSGGRYPVTYLKLWKKNKNVENLINAGWWNLIEQSIAKVADYNPRDLRSWVHGVDFTKAKPHEMLKMSKADFKVISRRSYKWPAQTFEKWSEYYDSGGGCSALEFEKYYKEAHDTGVAALLALREEDDQIDFPQVARYMQKQKLSLHDLRYLVDARQMAEALNPDRELTHEELWPRRLMAVHDRLQAIQRVQQDAKKTKELQSGFDRVVAELGCLEWTDGDLRIVLPRGNDDLIREGSTLQHCVSGYGPGHVDGRGVIFFVRKYRRPERSFFTLDINMKVGAPSEVQLHGFKNEHVKIGKTRRIPKRVRAFVDRWKTEVLMPWYLQQMNSKEKTA